MIEVIVVIALAWCIVNFALKKVTVIGSAMENTLNNGEEVLVNTFFKHFFSFGRYDIIAFYPEKSNVDSVSRTDSNILIRRIVGLPGETVRITEGVVYINNTAVEEEYKFDRNVSSGQADKDYKLGEDEYFVLSDKRSDLDDSRSASFTKVKKGNIIGEVFLCLSPFRIISGPDDKTSEDAKEDGKDDSKEKSKEETKTEDNQDSKETEE